MRLAATTDKLQLVTSAAASIDSVVNYIDASSSTGAFSGGGSQRAAITTAATTDILAAPGASTLRDMTSGTWRNKHASLSCDVTVVLDANGTDYELHKATLAPGDCLEYIENIGFFTLKASDKLDKLLVVTADVINATTAFADITGLTYPVTSGKTYSILAELFHANDAATTGSRFGFNGPAMTYDIYATIDTVTPSVTASAHSAGAVTAQETAITAQTTGSTSNRLAHIAGIIVPSADGTLAARCASEIAVAAGLTVRRGSWMWLREADNA
jgi:hypothetical protein